MIRLSNSNELFRTINQIADGNSDAPNNTIEPVQFMVITANGFDNRVANSMWAATEWLKKHGISPFDVIWQ